MSANSLNLPGRPGESGADHAPAAAQWLTSIDLRKPGDLALLNRAVVNGWDAPQHVRDQICAQLVPAMDSYVEQMKTAPTPSGRDRATKHVIKLAMLALKMDATNLIAAGCASRSSGLVTATDGLFITWCRPSSSFRLRAGLPDPGILMVERPSREEILKRAGMSA